MRMLLSLIVYITVSGCRVAASTSWDTIFNKTRKGQCEGIICDLFVCIPIEAICDRQENCQDGSDERFCPCPESKFPCHDGYQCLPEILLCDGSEDCDDASDESDEQCEGSAALPPGCFENDMASCDDNLCINITQICDGHPDCQDGSDEIFCASPEGSGEEMDKVEIVEETSGSLGVSGRQGGLVFLWIAYIVITRLHLSAY